MQGLSPKDKSWNKKNVLSYGVKVDALKSPTMTSPTDKMSYKSIYLFQSYWGRDRQRDRVMIS
jgi:hypothetical protein